MKYAIVSIIVYIMGFLTGQYITFVRLSEFTCDCKIFITGVV